jgi:hypothetical protein
MRTRQDKTPSQELEATRLANDCDRLGRRDVEPRRKFRHLVEPEDVPMSGASGGGAGGLPFRGCHADCGSVTETLMNDALEACGYPVR